ncbi:MAG: carboxylating nicotinate-nucleotide diphosphorylase [Rudaea sp.]
MTSPILPPLADDIAVVVQRALAEDVGAGDLTSVLVPEPARFRARVISRERAVLCGTAWFDQVFRQLDARMQTSWLAHDGDDLCPEQTICELHGPARAMLAGERTALNFLQTLSGTATLARQYAAAVADLPVEILDTRKTLPGLRCAQKYAVACGGCHNHRRGLYDGVLIKENHLHVLGSVGAAVRAAKSRHPDKSVEVEAETLEQLAEAIEAGADIVLLDNFEPARLREAVVLCAGRTKLEASGGITLDNVRDYALTGVDRISVGSLTKDVRAVDLSMRFTV